MIHQIKFEAIGTSWCIDLETNSEKLEILTKEISNRIEAFDKAYSRFRSDSWVNQISKKAGSYKTPDDFSEIFEFYELMYLATEGAVTPLIGKVMERAGYDANYSLVSKTLHKPHKFNSMNYKNNTLHVKYCEVLDFGAAGKGYLVDLVSKIIEKHNVISYLVDAGGDMRHSPASTSHFTPVALEDPNDPSKAIGIAQLKGKSIAGSAGNRRNWGKYHHIIDPRTLQSVTDIQASWAIADSCMLADGMSTCLFFTPPEALLEEFDFEYLIIKADNSISISEQFPAEIFYH